ncbi:hypothetical protein scyTo_0006113 [Scyliorhinus torazame]|uniref:Insulin-like domain-containing protein n=1 Tax=Scyliorhinus torazame TaxID=75743 RepID=A0A401PFJ4_SCYTO|nr:hypothetical protein [Scyliorhinus torazame]
MKGLVFVLAVGLMLPHFIGCEKPEKRELKLCGRDFIDKLLETCASLKARMYHPYDSFQPPAGNNGMEGRIYTKMDPRGSYNAPQPFYNGYNIYGQVPGDFHEFALGADRDAKSPRARTSPHSKLKRRQLESKCCEVGCTREELIQRCKP